MKMNDQFSGPYLAQMHLFPPSAAEKVQNELTSEPIEEEQSPPDKQVAMTKFPDLPRISPSFREHRLNWISGSHNDLSSEYQLLLMIQPNCPGCLANAIPVANAIASQSNDFDTYCVSTAFEDFHRNNIFGAKALLEGRLSGKAAKRLGPETHHVPQMPFAHDYVVDRKDADLDFKEWALHALLESAREQLRMLQTPEDIIDEKLSLVGYEALPEKLAELFWTVKAEGSPTWVIHKSNGEVLDVKFGYLDEKEIRKWVGRLVPTSFSV